jgi:hypothetical protein
MRPDKNLQKLGAPPGPAIENKGSSFAEQIRRFVRQAPAIGRPSVA